MITLTELEKIASLAKLSLENEDVDSLAADISEMVEFANAVVTVETDDSVDDAPEVFALREDVVAASYPNEKLLSNAGEVRNGFFVAEKTGGALGEQNQ